ncbi:C-C motif chemokine 15 [Ochotona curzoniae]|uniref:C-C motif chemokine 15 n=1 Tax=Ochotona curzoniae TaxID=130825 RepID=UPI001B347C0D|nr:C-C motif chemokine 15 [Ochotona curzoniae]
MKLSMTALSLLILATALGAQARVIHDAETRELAMEVLWPDRNRILSFHRPTECCFSYITRSIRCSNMIDYFETSSQCSWSAVIFRTKRGQQVCADPRNKKVQECMINLKPDWVNKNLETIALARA